MSNTNLSSQSEEQVSELLYRKGATDGLPVVPPTDERVTEMFRGTDLPPNHGFGSLEGVPLTVRKLAINGVMAGCDPIHMPVLVAGAKALVDPAASGVRDAVSSRSWAYLWLVNGPIRSELDVRSDTGAMGPGFRANRCIGRAFGFTYENTTPDDSSNSSAMGNPFRHTLVAGENEERSPWDPFHVTAGFDEETSTITFGGQRSFTQYLPYDMSTEGVLKGMMNNTLPDMSSIDEGRGVVHALAPYNAEELSRAGLNKRDVATYLCENSHRPIEEYDIGDGIEGSSGDASAELLQIPRTADPNDVTVLVIGGSGRFNMIGQTAGWPVTKEIEFPAGWESLLEEYRVEREALV